MRRPAGSPARTLEVAEGWSAPPPRPEIVQAVLAATRSERDRLLLRTLWATGARLSDILALRPRDIRSTGLLLPNPQAPRGPGTLVQLTETHAGLPAALRRWARVHALTADEPLFFSRERAQDGRRKPIDRVRAWQIVSQATRRAETGAVTSRAPASGPRARAASEAPARPAPAQAAANEARLTTNVGPPVVRPRLVPRPRLVEALDGVPRYPVTLVAAPAGFGKTTTLATWEAQIRDRLAVAWVSLGIGDNDPVRFWRGLLAALQAQQPGVGASAVARLQAGAPIPLVVDDLLGDLARLATPLALVLDDYHVIETPEVHTGLGTIVGQCPPAFHLVLSTRADPPLPLARLRSLGQLLELRAADLHFSRAEAAGLLGEALGVELSPEHVAVLEARTEGWAAGLHLAALALRTQTDVPSAVADFAGTDRSIVDYFAEEILNRLPEQARVFLERTSILERLSPALCDAVVGEPGSAAVLSALERANVFLTPLDAGRQWFRYHQLFADALRHRLERNAPTLMPVLHARASAWYATHELLDDAIEHALAGGCWDRAADLLAQVFLPLVQRGEELTLRRWLLAVPEAVCTRHPVLSRATATALLMSGDLTRLERFLASAEPILEAAGEHEALGGLLSMHAIQLAIQAQLSTDPDDLAGAVACAERVLHQPEATALYRAEALGALVHCHLLRGDAELAGQTLEQMGTVSTGNTVMMYWSQTVFHAQQLQQAGNLTRAAAVYRGLLDQIGQRAVYARQQAWLGLATIALEWNRLDEAMDHLERIEQAGRLSGRTYRTIDVAAPLLRARVLRARRQLVAAGEALHAATEAARQRASAAWERLVRAEAAWIALLEGRLADAVHWADELEGADLAAYAREPEALMLVRVRRAQATPGAVAPALERLLSAAEAVGRADSTIALLIQLALVREQDGDAPGALAALERAVHLTEPGGYVRVFLDEGEPALILLRRLLRRGGSPARTARLLQAFDRSGERAVPTPQLLTRREREVLRLLALGLPNRAIAERLVTSETTIKSHVHHLIDKLGASSRAEVLVRARELGELGELDGVSRPGGAR